MAVMEGELATVAMAALVAEAVLLPIFLPCCPKPTHIYSPLALCPVCREKVVKAGGPGNRGREGQADEDGMQRRRELTGWLARLTKLA
jgi:hypothetical protein